MINILIFILFFYTLLLSTIGYGILFKNLCFEKFESLNDENSIYIGFYGLCLITLISLITSLFFSHNFLHNLLLHGAGIFYLIFVKTKDKKKYLKFIVLISLAIFSLLLISKTNDDLPYYHLPFTKYLTEQKIIFGMGHLNHGYNLLSSLFFLNSTFYLPFIKYSSFHFGILFSLIFFNFFLLKEIFSNKNHQIINTLYIFAFAYFNLSFNRLAEFGTDKSGQLIIVILTIKLFDLVCFNQKSKRIEKILFLVPLLAFCITLKTYFLPYILLSFVLFFINNKQIKNLKFILNSKSFIFFIVILFFNFLHHFISTGCFISPLSFTCFGDYFLWARDIIDIKNLSIWLEQWAKAGAGPGYRIENPLVYIENFNWLSNWTVRYFTGKFLDQILILVVAYIVIGFLFKNFSQNNNQNLNKKKILFYYLLLLIVFFIWFTNHPTLRYGGYSIFFLIISIPVAIIMNNFKNRNSFNIKFKLFVIFVVIVLNFKNFDRIKDEFKREDMYKFSNFPFFSIHNPNFAKKKFADTLIMYSAEGHCWSTPTPCGNINNIKVSKKNGYYFLNKVK